MLPRTLALSCCFALSLSAHAQEQLGIRLSNYGGINSSLLNPAYHTTTPFSWDVNLVEGASHIWNNYAYFREASLLSLLRGIDEIEVEFGPDFVEGAQPKPGSVAIDFARDDRVRGAYVLNSIMGPSFYVQIGENHRIGFLSRARIVGSARNIDTNYSYYDYDRRAFFDDFAVEPFRTAVAGWSEIGANYAYSGETATGTFGVGISLKVLQAYEGIFFTNLESFRYQKLPNDSIGSTSPANFIFGYTTSNLDTDNLQAARNGGGLAADLGLVLTIDGEDEAPYLWKFGFSLLDLGRLNFSRNAESHTVNIQNPVSIATDAYRSFSRLEEGPDYIRLFSSQTLGDSAASRDGAAFGLWLPAAFSFQADRALGGPFFAGATYTQGFPVGEAALQRGSLLAIVPRMESRWLEAALPISIYDWQQLRVGLAIRLAFLTVGSSHLGSIFQKSDFRGTDLYVALKVNPFQFGERDKGWSPGRQPKLRGGKKGRIRCYEF